MQVIILARFGGDKEMISRGIQKQTINLLLFRQIDVYTASNDMFTLHSCLRFSYTPN